MTAILDLKEIAVNYGAESFSAVATEAFRRVELSHRQSVLERIRKETEFQVRVIPQEQEARIGSLATAVAVDIPRLDLVVWDIGGGSMQISYWDEGVNPIVGYLGQFASDAMQQHIIENIQGRDLLTASSPNPSGSVSALEAIREAERVARDDVPPLFREHMATVEKVIGIGGVHFSSNCEFLQRVSAEDCKFSREELRQQIEDYAHLTDEELVENGFSTSIDFARGRVSNAALTVGFMNVLSVENVRAIEMNMAGGILLDSDFWGTVEPDEQTVAVFCK